MSKTFRLPAFFNGCYKNTTIRWTDTAGFVNLNTYFSLTTVEFNKKAEAARSHEEYYIESTIYSGSKKYKYTEANGEKNLIEVK